MVNETSLLAAPRRTGRERAQARVPLTMVLHAYRLTALYIWDRLVGCAARTPTSSRALLDSASALWNAVDVYCQELAAAYRDVETEQLLRDVRVREAALASLFSGRAPRTRASPTSPTPCGSPRSAASSWSPPTPGRWSTSARRRPPNARWPRSASARPGARRPTARSGLVVLTRTQRVDRLMGYLTSLTVGRVGISETFEPVVDTPQAVTRRGWPATPRPRARTP